MGEFHLDDPLLDDVWGLLEDADVPVLVHAGSGPVGNDFTGPGSMQRLLERHPRLPIIVAHMGAPEVVRFLRLAEQYERVRLDTTMCFTDFFGEPYPDWLVPRLVDLQPKILLGTDFPTIPYPYGTSSRGWPGSTSATTGCGRCAGRTAPPCSERSVQPIRTGGV